MKIVGFNTFIMKKCTCYSCGAIIEYLPSEVEDSGHTDEGSKILGFQCPNCNVWVRTNH